MDFKTFYLKEEESAQIYTDEFKKWFGDWEKNPSQSSKVVDDNGKPLRVYHGTPDKFTEFNKNGWFSTSPEDASSYSNVAIPNREFTPNVKPVYIHIKRPKYINHYILKSDAEEFLNNSKRYDGLIILKSIYGDGEKHFVVKNPHQIKSAIGNKGTFSATNLDIREDLVTEVASVDILEKWFNEFNMSLFDGKLPSIPIKLMNSKTVGGVTKGTVSNSGVTKVSEIGISRYYKSGDDRLKGILVHEMIHAFFILFGDHKENHGYVFRSWVKRLQAKVDFVIPLEDTIDGLELGDHVKVKTFDVILIKNSSMDRYSICVMKQGGFNAGATVKEFITDYDHLVLFENKTMFFIQSDDSILMRYTTSRKPNSKSFYVMKNEDAERILQNGKLFLKVDKDLLVKSDPQHYKQYM